MERSFDVYKYTQFFTIIYQKIVGNMKIYTILNFPAQTKTECKIWPLNRTENSLFTYCHVRLIDFTKCLNGDQKLLV